MVLWFLLYNCIIHFFFFWENGDSWPGPGKKPKEPPWQQSGFCAGDASQLCDSQKMERNSGSYKPQQNCYNLNISNRATHFSAEVAVSPWCQSLLSATLDVPSQPFQGRHLRPSCQPPSDWRVFTPNETLERISGRNFRVGALLREDIRAG